MNSFSEAFSQVPEIAMRIERSKLVFEPENNCYSTPEWDSTSCSDEGFVNASWWAWETRQGEINLLTEALAIKEDLNEVLRRKDAKNTKRVNDLKLELETLHMNAHVLQTAIFEMQSNKEKVLKKIADLAKCWQNGERNAVHLCVNDLLEEVIKDEQDKFKRESNG